MTVFALAHSNVAAGRESSDSTFFAQLDDRLVIAVADGAGGTTRGREAARVTTALIAHECTHAVLDDEERIAHVLRSIDVRLTRERGGQTTAVCVAVSTTAIVGASAGDSEAWLVDGEQITRLTAGQSRKPLLGDAARIIPFRRDGTLRGTLVVASDGLFGYVREEQVLQASQLEWVEQVADALVTAARLPGGKMQDDLAMFVVRPR